MTDDEWRPWADFPPYAHRWIEIKRDGNSKVETIDPLAVHPKWNVMGVWWRPSNYHGHPTE